MPKITLRNKFHNTSIVVTVSEAVARADQPMIELACEAEGGDKSAARTLKRIEIKLCGIAGCQCAGQIVKAPSRGPKIRGTAKRVLISATVAPETAAKLRELAAQAGNMGRALDAVVMSQSEREVVAYILERAIRCMVRDGDSFVADSDDFLASMDSEAMTRLQEAAARLKL